MPRALRLADSFKSIFHSDFHTKAAAHLRLKCCLCAVRAKLLRRPDTRRALSYY
jgi:hypothetical protein